MNRLKTVLAGVTGIAIGTLADFEMNGYEPYLLVCAGAFALGFAAYEFVQALRNR